MGDVRGEDELRVAVVVDDEWRRRGVVDGLRSLGGVLGCTWAGSPLRTEAIGLEQPEIVVLGIDVDQEWDQYAGLGALAALRAAGQLAKEAHVVGVVTTLTNPLIAVRAAESGVNALCSWSELRDLPALERALLTPPLEWRPGERMAFSELRELGVSPTASLSAGLSYIRRHALEHAFENGAFTRRKRITLRRTLADLAGIRATASSSGAQNQPVIPSWQQIQFIFSLARGTQI
jgi:hypothetical protein